MKGFKRLLGVYSVSHPSWDGEAHFALLVSEKGQLAGTEIEKPEYSFWRDLKTQEVVHFEGPHQCSDWFSSVVPAYDSKLGSPSFTYSLFYVAGGDEGEHMKMTINEKNPSGLFHSDGAYFSMADDLGADGPIAQKRTYRSIDKALQRLSAFGGHIPEMVEEQHGWVAPIDGLALFRQLCKEYYEQTKTK